MKKKEFVKKYQTATNKRNKLYNLRRKIEDQIHALDKVIDNTREEFYSPENKEYDE